LLGELLRRAARRYQQHRRSVRGAALDRYAAGRGSARARARMDLRARRTVQSARVHALLARVDRRMAVGPDAESAARGHREPEVVPVQHLQLRELGTRDADPARGAVRAPPGEAAAARSPPRRAVPRRPRADALSAAARRAVLLAEA